MTNVDETPREVDHEPTDEVAAAICERFSGSVATTSHGQVVVHVAREALADVARSLRDDEGFTMCVDITAVDHLRTPGRSLPAGIGPERFEVVANFLAHARNRRVRVVAQVPAGDPVVPSLTGIYPGTEFPEREVYDLLGISFSDHPDLTRILMPDDWVGHPLRKDTAAARVPVTFKESPSPR
ncbi:MAG: NADH-quinone oxidoreductase subunit C [Actinomycetota bacterium]